MSASKEIGGYFGLDIFRGKEYYQNLIGVNSGRNALLYILKARNVSKLYIPSFLCDTVYKLCERENFPYEFYQIDENFLPVFNKKLLENEWLYIVNFYGQISNRQIKFYKKKYVNVIFDNVQAFFQKPLKNIDTIYSCRKFFGVPDGGYVSTNAKKVIDLEVDFSAERMKHILGRFEKTGSEFYLDFQENDENFYDLDLKKMSFLTKNILCAVDYKFIESIRNKNYIYLERMLGKHNKLNLNRPIGPYCYPFYCKNGMAIKKELAKKKIYIPTLWPNVLETGNDLEIDYAMNILPIPCDQRYNEKDMENIVNNLCELY